MYKQLSMRWF